MQETTVTPEDMKRSCRNFTEKESVTKKLLGGRQPGLQGA